MTCIYLVSDVEHLSCNLLMLYVFFSGIIFSMKSEVTFNLAAYKEIRVAAKPEVVL